MALASSLFPQNGNTPSPRRERGFSLVFAALGGAAICAALFAGAAQLQTALAGHARATAAARTPADHAFGAPLTNAHRAEKRLPGISGEMFAPAVARDDSPAASHGEFSLAAWDRLSSGNCITLTTQSGQTLSFRIVGTKQMDASDTSGSPSQPEIDLAVTTCDGGAEPIAKAVIESSQQPAKDAVAQRTL